MRTTININRYLSEKLINTSEDLNLPYHVLIVKLVEYTISRNKFKVRSFQGVQYQDRDPEKNWEKLHVTFDMAFYEKGLDLKKVSKLSFSHFISLAIIHFLDELAEKLSNPKEKN
jgi:hypothetical protein